MEFGMLVAVARQWHDGMYTQMRDADSVQTQLSGGPRRVLFKAWSCQCCTCQRLRPGQLSVCRLLWWMNEVGDGTEAEGACEAEADLDVTRD